MDANGEFACGHTVKSLLKVFLAKGDTTCHSRGRDQYDQMLGVCFYDEGNELNRDLVRYGWAMAYREHSQDYVEEETESKRLKSGLWAGGYTPPWEWRKKMMRETGN